VNGNTDPTQVPGPAGTYRSPSPAAAPAIPGVEINAWLGQGGMGVVWKGRQPFLDRTVAVKVLTVGRDAADREWVRRFQREARFLAGLQHAHIVSCYQAGVADDGTPWLVMEFIDGPTLRQQVSSGGPLPVAEALRLTAEVAAALQHAHASGIIHRDVKPENVLLAPSPGRAFPWLAKLVDLGLARSETKAGGSEALTRVGSVLGTPATMAPEQLDTPETVDHRADIYGLGCVLFHALTGSAAFGGTTMAQIITAKLTTAPPDVRSLRSDVPAAVAALVARMLARSPDDRPQTYDEVIAACSAAPSAVAPATNRSLVAALLVGLLVALVAIAAVAWRPAAPAPAPALAVPALVPQPAVPAVVPQPAAPPAPIVAAPAFVGPLWEADLARRLSGWERHGEAVWVADEEGEDAVVGHRGIISRPLPSGLVAMSAMVLLANGETKTDEAGLGLALADGSTAVLMVKNLGQGVIASIDRSAAVGEIWQAAAGPTFIPVQGDAVLSMRVSWANGVLHAAIAGKDLDLSLPLPAAPQRVLLRAEGKAPARFTGLAGVRAP